MLLCPYLCNRASQRATVKIVEDLIEGRFQFVTFNFFTFFTFCDVMLCEIFVLKMLHTEQQQVAIPGWLR